jgi:hypothetical protein
MGKINDLGDILSMIWIQHKSIPFESFLKGAKELNPVMVYYHSHRPQVFITVKQGLTALPMLIILFANEAITSRYRRGAGRLFHVCGAFLFGVVIWELFLLSI